MTSSLQTHNTKATNFTKAIKEPTQISPLNFSID